jgi:D-alanyl-D-alanine carboxypeptidase
MHVRLATLAGVLALLIALGVRPLADPPGARAMGPLPACRYDDILTTPRGYDDWAITLVDTILRVPKGYVPPNLVPASQAGIAGKGQVRAVMIDDLRAMSEAAAAAGSGIGVHSAYRSYATQQAVFANWVAVYGRSKALTLSARPGHSEHQLGLAVDFRSDPPDPSTLSGSWAATAAGKWMKAHAWQYGFVMSYPKGKIDVVCYAFEPWHYRYVGRAVAADVHASGKTLREYLWANYTTAFVPAKPTATRSPTKTAAPTRTSAPSPKPTAMPSLSPSDTPPSPPLAETPAPATNPAPSPIAGAPGGSSPPVDEHPVADQAPVLLAGGALIVAAAVMVLSVLRRRGRSGVGL